MFVCTIFFYALYIYIYIRHFTQKIGQSTLKRIRKFKKLDSRIHKAELDLEFLLRCRDSHVIRINFRVSSRSLKALFNMVYGQFPDGHFSDRHFPYGQIPDGYFPDQTLPRPDTSPTDTSPTRHFPDGHFPDGHFREGHFPDQTHPWRMLPQPDKFFLFLIWL